jgi:hypothetical protein
MASVGSVTLLLWIIPANAQNSQAKAVPSKKAIHAPTKRETPHLEFVTEYLRELAAIEDIRENAAADENKNDPNSTFTAAIHTGTLMQLELKSQIGMLKQMRLDDPFNKLIPGIIEFYPRKRWTIQTTRPSKNDRPLSRRRVRERHRRRFRVSGRQDH